MILLLVGCLYISEDDHAARLAELGGGGDDSAADDTGGVDTAADATGLVGAIGEFAMFKVVGGYWAEEDYRRASLSFIEPAPEWTFWKYWAPELDSCLHIDSAGRESFTYDPGLEKLDTKGGTVTLTELSYTSFDLDWNRNDLVYERYDIPAAQYIAGGVYTMDIDGSAVLPDSRVAGAYYLPEPFQVTSPPIDGMELQDITLPVAVRWTGGAPAEAVLIQIGMLNASGTTFEEQVYCAARDDGSFEVPEKLWTSWAPGRTVNIIVGRYLTGDGTLPWNNASVGTVGQYYLYGAGTSR